MKYARFCGPAGQGFALDLIEQGAVIEVAIGQHGDAQLLGQRQHALLDAAFVTE